MKAFPTRGTWALLALSFLLFAAYASLLPFDLEPVPFDDAVSSFGNIVTHPLRVRLSRTDLVANVLLFVPVGFCLTGALRLGRARWWSGPVASVVALAVSVPWSLAIEFAQLFTADRVTSMADVGAQTLGTVVGVVLWEAFGDEVTGWLRQATGARSRAERVERALAAYVVLWAFVNLAPFDLTLDVGTLGGRLRRGAIQLVPIPFGGRDRPLGPWLWDLASTALAAVPVGAYTVLGRTRDLSRRHWLRAAELAAALLLLLELSQIFVRSHRADVNDLLMGAVGAGAGIWLASRLSHRPATENPLASGALSWGAVAALAGWCLVLAAYHWMPYDFGADTEMIRRKLARVSLVPFAGYRSGQDLNALNQLLIKSSLGLPLGFFAGFVRRGQPGTTPRLATAAWLAFAAAVLGVIEAGQAFLPTRHPDPTDVLVGVAAAGVGLALARWIRRGH